MIVCKLCKDKREFSSYKALARHLYHSHKDTTSKEYYLKFIDPTAGKCPICNSETEFIGLGKGFKKHCSSKCAQNDPNTRKLIEDSTEKHFGVRHVMQSKEHQKKVQKIFLDRYNVDHQFKIPEVRKSIEEKCTKKFGGISPMCSKTISSKAATTFKQKPIEEKRRIQIQKENTSLKRFGVLNPGSLAYRYTYKNINFDSSWELAMFIWLSDHQISFEYHPNKYFEFTVDNKVHKYYPDFSINGKFVEIKGTQFLKVPGTMTNPFDHSKNKLWAAKFQCMKDNGVEIVTDCSVYLNYVKSKYGKDYLKQFLKK